MVWRDDGGEALFAGAAFEEDSFQFRPPAASAEAAATPLLVRVAQGDAAAAEPCAQPADTLSRAALAERLAAIDAQLDALDGGADAPERRADRAEDFARAPTFDLWLSEIDALGARLAGVAAAPGVDATLAELAAAIQALREEIASARDAAAEAGVCERDDDENAPEGEGDAAPPAFSSARATGGLDEASAAGAFRDIAAQSIELGGRQGRADRPSGDLADGLAEAGPPPPRDTFSAESALAAIEALLTAIDASAEAAERDAILGESPWSDAALTIWLDELDQSARQLDAVASRAGPGFAAQIGALEAALAELSAELEGLRGGPAFTVADFDGAGQVVFLIDDGWNEIYQGAGETPVWQRDYYDNDDDARGDGLFGATMLEVVRAEAPGVTFAVAKVFSDDGFDGGEFALYEQALADAAALDAAWDAAGGLNIAATLIGVGTLEALTEPETGDPFGVSDDFAALAARSIANIATSGDFRFFFFDADGVSYPAADPSVIAVSSTTADGAAVSDSQRDPLLTDIFAWGYDRPVTDEFGFTASNFGTDLAAAAVAGMVARLQQAADAVIGEALTDAELVAILQASGAALVDGVAPAPDGYVQADGDAAVGYFLLNVDNFV